MAKIRQLFGEEEIIAPTKAKFGSEIKVNQEFASKYDKRETKKLLAKSKNMESEEESEEYSDEDSEGVLINDTVEKKFLETIARIRANDPKLKDQDNELFKDQDFDVENIKEKIPEAKPVTFKSLMADKVKRRFGENLEKNVNEIDDDDSENEEEKKETDVQMQRRLKADFIDAAHSDQGSESDILLKKPKTAEQMKKEKEDFEKLNQEADQKKYDEDKYLKEFWGKKAEKKLTNDDKFLRSYILGEKWRDNNEEFDEEVDDEDDDRDSEMEEFEENYNFRFEERDGDKIRTYPRTIEDTYRLARNKRMDNKIAKKKRMKEYIKEKKQEREQIAALKRNEIIDRLKQAEDISGSGAIAKKISKELQTDFDPELYDKIMASTFNEEYYNEDDEKSKVFERTIVDDYGEVSRYDEKPKPENEQADNEEEEKLGEEDQQKMKHLKKKREVKQAFKDLEQEENYDVWYSCDGCYKAVKPGKFRFDCRVCDNFTFCQK